MTDSENPVSKGTHPNDQLDTEAGAPHCGVNPQLAQGKEGKDPPMFKLLYNIPLVIQTDVISIGCKLLFSLMLYSTVNKLPPPRARLSVDSP